jgi:hypothetical protein
MGQTERPQLAQAAYYAKINHNKEIKNEYNQ